MNKKYFKPLIRSENPKPKNAYYFAGQRLWFDQFEVLDRGTQSLLVPADNVPKLILENLLSQRQEICGLEFDNPKIMGIINVTPDSFSDGGKLMDVSEAYCHAAEVIKVGAHILDIGGESTRPGASYISSKIECDRVLPLIKKIRKHYSNIPISIDTRKADVASAALCTGAQLFNDVSALRYDPDSIGIAARLAEGICLMHTAGDSHFLHQQNLEGDIVLDIYDFLESQRDRAICHGIPKEKIILDPGIGFGKNKFENIRILKNIGIYHSLGCPLLVGLSRKRFIGEITGVQEASERKIGSVVLGYEMFRQGVQILRVHDIEETKQALDIFNSLVY